MIKLSVLLTYWVIIMVNFSVNAKYVYSIPKNTTLCYISSGFNGYNHTELNPWIKQCENPIGIFTTPIIQTWNNMFFNESDLPFYSVWFPFPSGLPHEGGIDSFTYDGFTYNFSDWGDAFCSPKRDTASSGAYYNELNIGECRDIEGNLCLGNVIGPNAGFATKLIKDYGTPPPCYPQNGTEIPEGAGHQLNVPTYYFLNIFYQTHMYMFTKDWEVHANTIPPYRCTPSQYMLDDFSNGRIGWSRPMCAISAKSTHSLLPAVILDGENAACKNTVNYGTGFPEWRQDPCIWSDGTDWTQSTEKPTFLDIPETRMWEATSWGYMDLSTCHSNPNYLGFQVNNSNNFPHLGAFISGPNSCMDQCSGGQCDGDAAWRHKHGSYPNSNCFCNTGIFKQIPYYKNSSDAWFGMLRNFTITLGYEVYHGSHKPNQILSTVTCSVSLETNILSFACTDDVLIKVVKHGITMQQSTIHKVTQFTVSDTMLITSGSIIATYYQGDIVVGNDVIPTIGSNPCLESTCYLCLSTLEHFSCQSSLTKFLIVIILFMITVASLVALSVIIYISCFFFKTTCLVGFYSCKCCQRSVTYARDTTKSVYENVKQGYKEATKSDVEMQRLVSETPRTSGFAASRSIYKVVIICLLLPRGESLMNCVGGMTIASDTTECSSTDSTETCVKEFSLITSLPFAGATGCFSIQNEDNSSTVSTMTIHYDKMVNTVQLTQLYTTSAWRGFYGSNTDCWTPSNWCGDRCDQMSPDDVTGHGHFTFPDLVINPGITTCTRPCGGWGCGCFYDHRACQVKRWAVKPVPPYTTIYSPGSQTYTAIISVNVTTPSGLVQQLGNVIVRPGVPVTIGSFTISLIGSFINSASSFGTKKIRRDDSGYVAFTDACDLNAPCLGLPGDIQSNSIAQLQSTSVHDTTQFTPLLATPEGDAFLFAQNGVLAPSVPLPALFDNRLWSYAAGAISTEDPNSSPLLLQVSTNKPISFTRQITVVCPNVKLVSVDGCFACPMGASINITAWSTCLIGIVAVSTDDLSITVTTPSIPLSNEKLSYLINFQSSSKTVSFELAFTSEDKHASVFVEATLFSYTTVNNATSHTQGEGSVVKDSGLGSVHFDGKSIGNFFSKTLFGNWWSSILSTIGMILTVVATIWTIKQLINIKRKRDLKKLEDKDK